LENFKNLENNEEKIIESCQEKHKNIKNKFLLNRIGVETSRNPEVGGFWSFP
jgi:hypothetical protein